jgi:hypothetical protein
VTAVLSARTELLLAIPYEPDPFGTNPSRMARNEVILRTCAEMPNLFPLRPETVEERMIAVAQTLTAPDSYAWEVWRGSALCGMLLLTHCIPGYDALAHFAFFDRQLFGRSALMQRVIGQAFARFGLERLTAEIPEHLTALVDFARRKLGFRYEGEPKAHAEGFARARSLAAWGSRREHAYRDGVIWRDLIRLRLLRGEHEARQLPGG